MSCTLDSHDSFKTYIACRSHSSTFSAAQEALTQMMHIEEVFCWTDSITVFHWIQSAKEFKQFVQNRIDKIHKFTVAKRILLITRSRGCLASELLSRRLWWKRPDWLLTSLKFGAVSNEELTEECSREFKETERISGNVAHTATRVILTKEPKRIKTIKFTEAIDCKRFNDATKLFRKTALSLTFIKNVKTARKQRREPQKTKPTLTVEVISEAKSLWIHELQEPMKHENNFKNLKQQTQFVHRRR